MRKWSYFFSNAHMSLFFLLYFGIQLPSKRQAFKYCPLTGSCDVSPSRWLRRYSDQHRLRSCLDQAIKCQTFHTFHASHFFSPTWELCPLYWKSLVRPFCQTCVWPCLDFYQVFKGLLPSFQPVDKFFPRLLVDPKWKVAETYTSISSSALAKLHSFHLPTQMGSSL